MQKTSTYFFIKPYSNSCGNMFMVLVMWHFTNIMTLENIQKGITRVINYMRSTIGKPAK